MSSVKGEEQENAKSQEEGLSPSEKHCLEQQDAAEQQVAAWVMSIGLDCCPQDCDELASLDSHAIKKQLLNEAKRRYRLQGLDKQPNFRAFKPNSAWNRDQIMKWLREHPIKDEPSIDFVRSKVSAMKKKQHADSSQCPRRRQRTSTKKKTTAREAISAATGNDGRLPPKVLMARVMGSPGCSFSNRELPEKILLAECKRRAASCDTTLKSILAAFLIQNPISNDELRDLMPQVNLLKAELEPTVEKDVLVEVPLPQQQPQEPQQPPEPADTGDDFRHPSSIPLHGQQELEQQQKLQSDLSPSDPTETSNMNSENSYMNTWSFPEEFRDHLRDSLKEDEPTPGTYSASNDEGYQDLLSQDVNESLLRHMDDGKKMTETQNSPVCGTFTTEPEQTKPNDIADMSEDGLEHSGKGHTSIDHRQLDASTTVASLPLKDATSNTGDSMENSVAAHANESSSVASFGPQSTAQLSMNQQGHNSERVCAMSITSAETALMNLSIESPPVDARSNPSDAPSAFSSFPDCSMPSVESSRPMSSRGPTGADQTHHDGNMEGLELNVQPQGDSVDDSRTIATVSVLTDVFGSTTRHDASSRQKVGDNGLLDPYGDMW